VRRDAGPEWTFDLLHPDLKRTRPDTPWLSPVSLKFSEHKQNSKLSIVATKKNLCPTKRHFFTLAPTLVDRELSVKEYRGEKCSFFQ
jgi:hypothetical protein